MSTRSYWTPPAGPIGVRGAEKYRCVGYAGVMGEALRWYGSAEATSLRTQASALLPGAGGRVGCRPCAVLRKRSCQRLPERPGSSQRSDGLMPTRGRPQPSLANPGTPCNTVGMLHGDCVMTSQSLAIDWTCRQKKTIAILESRAFSLYICVSLYRGCNLHYQAPKITTPP